MEEILHQFFSGAHWAVLGAAIAASLFVLGKSADWLVTEAVALSERSGIPKVVIAATIVSLGTTTPEAAVSVLAAVQGGPGLALGNAVGSIICDTGLILGLACVLADLRLDRKIVNRQGWIQLGAGAALVVASFPWWAPGSAFTEGGHLRQSAGFGFLLALAVYLVMSVRWSKDSQVVEEKLEIHEPEKAAPVVIAVLRLIGAIFLVVVSAQILIPAVMEAANRLSIPESIIAATMVAFGTSLPELVTAVTAARRGHGEIAVGNVVGADILNVLFVAGASAAVTPQGLKAGAHFFVILFPMMLLVLAIFRVGIILSGDSLKRVFGIVLLSSYLFYLVVSYLVPAG